MVGLDGIGRDHDEDADDEEKVEDDGEPGVDWEREFGLDVGEDGCEERDDPGKLEATRVRKGWNEQEIQAQRG